MKIFGHPIHIILIHFPSALFPMDFACAAIFYYSGTASFNDASFYAMCGGVILGWPAIIFGTIDLIKTFESRPDVVKKALIHGALNTTVLILYTVLAYVQYKHCPALQAATLGILGLKAAVNAIMIIGNFMGGDLILKHKIAVEK